MSLKRLYLFSLIILLSQGFIVALKNLHESNRFSLVNLLEIILGLNVYSKLSELSTILSEENFLARDWEQAF